MTDDFEGAKMATQHLINIGCQKIVFLKGPEIISTTFSRLMGYKEALKKNEFPIEQEFIIDHCDQQELSGCLSGLVNERKIDGLLAHSDYHAFKAIEIIQKLGYKVPDDINIIGYADEPLASYTTPKITTVKQPAFEMGRKGMEMLMGQIESGKMGEPQILNTELIIRESTRRTF
jgi:LacI family transcriptional regulator